MHNFETKEMKDSISSIIELSDSEWAMIADFIEIRAINKNDFFLKEGQICDSIAFLNKGIMIYYKTLDNANEITSDFTFEGEWVTNYHSLLNHSPSHVSIKAIEYSELLSIKQVNLSVLYDTIPQFNKLGRLFIEQAFVKLVQLNLDLQTLPAKDRYLKFLKNHPEIFQKIPLYHIANYLGIAPKSLSRIRSTILNE